MHNRHTMLPPVELTDPVWTIEHVALALRLQLRATRTVIAAPGFPAPFRTPTGANARKYWIREDVLAHFAALRTPAAAAPPARQLAPAPAAHAALPAPAVAALDPQEAALARLRSMPAASTRSAR